MLCLGYVGILTNVATEVVLRPQRTPDLLLVMDFNAYESDDHYDYNVSLNQNNLQY